MSGWPAHSSHSDEICRFAAKRLLREIGEVAKDAETLKGDIAAHEHAAFAVEEFCKRFVLRTGRPLDMTVNPAVLIAVPCMV